ncbi:MAG: MetQ/NlpA family ABC transporter substrate-binding protein [Peptostreptococcaceae bacterium]|nr:MetQ/NlpA family ABC transporter substrate-binding protein [Peptostreptococcaceae bacterium]
MKKTIKLCITLLAALFILTSCGTKTDSNPTNDSSNQKSEPTKIKIGVVGTNEEEIWKFVKEKVAKDNIELDIVVFTDYNQPNDALANGDIDLNAFQHYIFLDSYNKERNSDLTVIGETFISPLGIYSQKIQDVSEIKEGDTIAIPNDPTNGGRALLLLQSAELIKVDPAKGDTPTVNDIIENPLNLKISELDASQTARSLPDVAAAIINGGIAVDAELNPPSDAIFLEKLTSTSKPYINIIVSRAGDKDIDSYKKVVEAFRQDDTAKVIEDVTKGACIPVWKLD